MPALKISDFTLRRARSAIKGAVLVLGFSPAMILADANVSCPPLEVMQSCTDDGVLRMTLKPGSAAPAGLSYIIGPQGVGLAAQSLPANGSLTFNLPASSSGQMTFAVVGLEPDGKDMTACCLSNQRVHLSKTCRAGEPEGPTPDTPLSATDLPPTDLGIEVTLTPECQRSPQGAACRGVVKINGSGPNEVRVTLAAKDAARVVSDAVDCTVFAEDEALCLMPVGQDLPFDLGLIPSAPAGPVTLCARFGVAEGDTARTLALQSALAKAGYPVTADGDFGPATMAALDRFVTDSGLPPLQAEIPPAALALLGLAPHSDADPSNDLSCTEARLPAAPLLCDAKTARRSGKECTCRFKGMRAVSATACACPKGQKLGSKGCYTERVKTEVPAATATDPPPARCDALTTVLRNGACACRYEGMRKLSKTVCLCETGLPPLPGLGCNLPIIEGGKGEGP